MSSIRYKINGYWHEVRIEGQIEAIDYTNDPIVVQMVTLETKKKTQEI